MNDREIGQADLSESGRGAPPDEAQIIALLGKVQPTPTDRYYRRMDRAPWKAHRRMGWWSSPISRSLALAAAFILLAATGIALAFPTLSALARQWLFFFIPNPGENIHLQVTVPSPGDPNVFGSPGYFSLTIPEAERLAGFNAREIPLAEAAMLIPGLEFTGAHYQAEMKAVILRYSVDNRHLYLTQYPLGQIQEFNTIGPGAPVEKVIVHGVEGEYVVGGWKATRSLPSTASPGTAISLDAAWDPSLPQRILRWQESNFIFEILTSASLGREISLDQDDLVRIAEAIRE